MMGAVGAADERVAVYDSTGRVKGTETRGVVYRDGIWHGATGVLVRTVDGGQVVIHRRAAGKLVFPSLWDCWAGGVSTPARSPRAGRRGSGGAHRRLSEIVQWSRWSPGP
jgi:isopentenyldiphosphate isomerase